jgi:hypothetical protein
MGSGGLEHLELEVAGVRRGYWPGGPQYLPARIIGPISRHLNATGILLEQVTAKQDFPPPGCIR